MRLLILTVLASLLSLSAQAYPSMASHYEAHRSVIYFAPTKDEHVQQFLLETLINDCALKERDVSIMVVTADGFTSPNWVEDVFGLKSMFNRYKVLEEEHTAVLIGKDGGEKLRWGKETDWKEVKQTIDDMPMRQQEMLTRTSACSA
ncbi:DUF4174 domain-containing protein [Vibrio maerlii]|uniref:DUF4174 domain-containing protein n=1 Tax=Vibrio maerlii TaxID=2231648 RepID=UPI000E3CB405|nr:DUF4174 domain-containing protein [Vibrio maerlii]